MSYKLLILLGAFLAAAAAGAIGYRHVRQRGKVHYHAGFLIYINGQRQDFSAEKYMHAEVCGVEPDEKAHLHDGVGDVVHVHAGGTYWNDLFTWLSLDSQLMSTASGYPKDQLIKPYESVVIIAGSLPAEIPPPVSKDRILEVEQVGESCGD